MRLGDFILSNIEPILADWEVFARSIAPGARMDTLALRDHANAILQATVVDMKSAQSEAHRSAKAKGLRSDCGNCAALDGASVLHGVGRLSSGFDLLEVVSEYRALRASVLQLWHVSEPEPHERDISDLTRFNESIDQSLAQAVAAFTRKVDQSRDLFLAILSHDLRNPLNAISMSAQVLAQLNKLNPQCVEVTSQISVSVSVMARMISDLLDYTRTGLGTGMPVCPEPMDVGDLCRELFDEFRGAHPRQVFHYSSAGKLTGTWDVDRLRQAISNLMGNAVQHGDPAFPVNLKANGEGDELEIVVQNGGPPIPTGELEGIFEPLVRGANAQYPRKNRPGSMGLGLYIARQVATSHGGRIDVVSTQNRGTAFTIHLPRNTPSDAAPPTPDKSGSRACSVQRDP